MSLLDIAHIYVEDVFDYDLLLLSGKFPGLAGFPDPAKPVAEKYWSSLGKGDKKKKLRCMNFDKDCTPKNIDIIEFLNEAAEVDQDEGKLCFLIVKPDWFCKFQGICSDRFGTWAS